MANEVFDTDTLRDLIRETVKEALDDLTSAVERAASDGAESGAADAGCAAEETVDAVRRLEARLPMPGIRVMYVVSQAKRCVFPAARASVEHRPKEETYKYWLLVNSSDNNGEWVGKYKTFEEASAALCRFAKALAAGETLHYVE